MITVLGLGNPLLKDDGIGPRVVRELEREGLPPGVRAVEAGGSFFHYWTVFKDSKHVIVVDALAGGGAPGTLYLLGPAEIKKGYEGDLLRHEEDFPGALTLLEHFEIRPEVTIIGVEPKEVGYGLELSPEVAEKIPLILKAVRRQCRRLLHAATGSEK